MVLVLPGVVAVLVLVKVVVVVQMMKTTGASGTSMLVIMPQMNQDKLANKEFQVVAGMVVLVMIMAAPISLAAQSRSGGDLVVMVVILVKMRQTMAWSIQPRPSASQA